LEVTGLAFHDHRDRYLNQMIQILPVIGLVLSTRLWPFQATAAS